MSLINLNLAILAYEDGPKTTQPKLRLADLQWSLLGIPTKNFKNIPLSLAPGETATVTTTARTLTYDGSTSFAIAPRLDRMRITASLGQRTARSYGDSTTVFSLVKVDASIMQLQVTGGTPADFTTMRAGDYIYLSETYSPFNQGEFQLMKVGSNFVEFINTIGITESVTGGLNIYASGPVQRGDILDLTSSAFAMPNQGQFAVVMATDTFIEVLNADAYTETVTGITSGVMIYPFSYKWMTLVVDRKVVVGLNGAPPAYIEVEPPVEGDLTNSPGLFVKRGKVIEVQITNPTLSQVTGFLLLAE